MRACQFPSYPTFTSAQKLTTSGEAAMVRGQGAVSPFVCERNAVSRTGPQQSDAPPFEARAGADRGAETRCAFWNASHRSYVCFILNG